MSTSVAVKERPILFSGAMVRALLAGTKSQTRRVVKPQPEYRPAITMCSEGWSWREKGQTPHLAHWPQVDAFAAAMVDHCPYGALGDRLWVRETIAVESWTHEYGDTPPIPTDRPHKVLDRGEEYGPLWMWPHYRATDPPPDLCCEREGCKTCEDGEPGPHWRPSIHMPRWATRILLEITDVRVQRLQEISQDDAVAEGCEDIRDGKPLPGRVMYAGGPRDAYRVLWESINGAGSWDVNPWVWALTFKRVQP